MKGFTASSSTDNSPSKKLPSSLTSDVDDHNEDEDDSSAISKGPGGLSSKFSGLMSQLAKKDTVQSDSEDLSMNEKKS